MGQQKCDQGRSLCDGSGNFIFPISKNLGVGNGGRDGDGEVAYRFGHVLSVYLFVLFSCERDIFRTVLTYKVYIWYTVPCPNISGG